MARAVPWPVSDVLPRGGLTTYKLWQAVLTFSTPRLAAIASNLAKGMDVPTAVHFACRYIQPAISTAPGFGKGHGPLNHFHSTFQLPFSRYGLSLGLPEIL